MARLFRFGYKSNKKRFKLLIISCCCVAVSLLVWYSVLNEDIWEGLAIFTLNDNNNSHDNIIRSLIKPRSKYYHKNNRPIIYTFYYPIPTDIRHFGMTENDDNELLKTWEIAWHDTGWQPVVLSMDDAKKHKDFDHLYHSILGRNISMSIQEEIKFLKFLAMGAKENDDSDGGWYSDYDVFPLYMDSKDEEAKHLPNNGTFTMYDGFMASFVSASAEEWDRVGRRFIQFVNENHHNQRLDFVHSMQVFWPQLSDTVYQTNDILRRTQTELPSTLNDIDCGIYKHRRGVHFTEWTKQPFARAREGFSFLQMWRHKCYTDQEDIVKSKQKTVHSIDVTYDPNKKISLQTNLPPDLIQDYYEAIKHEKKL